MGFVSRTTGYVTLVNAVGGFLKKMYKYRCRYRTAEQIKFKLKHNIDDNIFDKDDVDFVDSISVDTEAESKEKDILKNEMSGLVVIKNFI
jgi:hypothetical protein